MRKLLNLHLYSKVVTKDNRGTPIDPNSCPYLPGGLGQLVCQAMGLDEGQPYLLHWAYNSVMDGAQPVQVRAVLAVLGFVPDFRWKRAYPERSLVHPVSATNFVQYFCPLFGCTDLSFCPGSGPAHWPQGADQWVAQGSCLPFLRGRGRWVEARLRCLRQREGQGRRGWVLGVARGSCQGCEA